MAKRNLTESTKLKIVELIAQKWSLRKISKKIKKSFGTVRSFVQRYRKSGSIQNKKSTGRPPKLTPKTKRLLLRHVKNNRKDSVKKIRENLQLHNVTKMTINNTLVKAGLKSHKATRKPLLTPKQRDTRLRWARKYSGENEEFWEKWIFTDESSFLIGSSNGQRVRRGTSEALLPDCLAGSKKWGTKLFFWGGISVHGVSDLVFIDGKMDSDVYINVLKEGLLPMYTRYDLSKAEMILQEDGDPKHQSAKTIKWKEKKGLKFLKDWPPNSPDLNPIENLWSMLKKSISIKKPVGVEETQQVLFQEWLRLEAEGVVMDLIRSMPRRIKAVIQFKGHPINY